MQALIALAGKFDQLAGAKLTRPLVRLNDSA